MNHLKTFTLLAALTALFVGLGYLIGGTDRHADRPGVRRRDEPVQLLERRQDRPEDVPRPAGRREHPEPLIRTYVADVVQMARDAGLPRPKIAIIPNDQPNAFATGRNPGQCGRLRHHRPAATP
jgi:heat shock protein HtpX